MQGEHISDALEVEMVDARWNESTTNPFAIVTVDHFSTIVVSGESEKAAATSSGSGNTGTIIYPDGTDTTDVEDEVTTEEEETVTTVAGMDDVFQDDYYAESVVWAVENGVTTGATDTTFAPESPATRAQVLTFLWRAAGSPEVEGTHDFTDVEAGSYYEMALLWAVENDITNGLGDGTFGVDQPCTRAQIVTFLYRFFH